MTKTAKELTEQMFSITTIGELTQWSMDLEKIKGTLERQELMNFAYLETRAIEYLGAKIRNPDFENAFSKMQKKYWDNATHMDGKEITCRCSQGICTKGTEVCDFSLRG